MQNEKVRPAKVRKEGRRQEARSNIQKPPGWLAAWQAGRGTKAAAGRLQRLKKFPSLANGILLPFRELYSVVQK